MCGRFTLWASQVDLESLFQVLRFATPPPSPRYNIPPTAQVPVVTQVDNAYVLAEKRWGLIPSWAKDPKIGYRTINARSETLATKPAFRAAYQRRRCLIPASGYYEWQAGSQPKQPYLIQMADGQPFAFAGLWETWTGPPDNVLAEPLSTFTIITTDSNDLPAAVHHRMPVIVAPEDFPRWLDPSSDPRTLTELFYPFPSEAMTLFAVSTFVNRVGNDSPECIEAQ